MAGDEPVTVRGRGGPLEDVSAGGLYRGDDGRQMPHQDGRHPVAVSGRVAAEQQERSDLS
jgi:hypothetical protein